MAPFARWAAKLAFGEVEELAKVVTVGTGSPNPSYELELISGQVDRHIEILACSKTGLFGAMDLEQSAGIRLSQVADRERVVPMLSQVWEATSAEGHWDCVVRGGFG